MVIRKIGVGSAARVFGTLYALWGFIFGAIIAMVGLAGAGFSAAAAEDGMPMWVGPMFGVGAVIFLPICYGILGALFGALTAAFYNLVADMAGGLSIDVE